MRIRVLFIGLLLSLGQLACSSRPTESDQPQVIKEPVSATQAELAQEFGGPEGLDKEPMTKSNTSLTTSAVGSLDSGMGGTEEKDVQCTKKEDIRWLQIEPLGDTGCKLWYTKDIGKKAIAWSSSARGHCNKARSKVTQRLESDGFTCREE